MTGKFDLDGIINIINIPVIELREDREFYKKIPHCYNTCEFYLQINSN